MRVSGEEVLRVSQLSTLGPDGVISVMGNVSTAPARRGSGEANPLPAASEFVLYHPAAKTAEARRVAEIVDKEPEVREDVVASLRARIESGGYQVSGVEIAEMMVRRCLADRVR